MHCLKKIGLAVNLSLAISWSAGCKPQAEPAPKQSVQAAQFSPPPISDADYNRVGGIIASSCMPCHNRQTLPGVISLTQKAGFKAIGDDTRLRILGELGELKNYMDSGTPISFTSKQEIQDFFGATAGEFYLMLEKGLMPPPWAPQLMEQIKWPNYRRLSSEQRLELMRFAKPYTEKYLR